MRVELAAAYFVLTSILVIGVGASADARCPKGLLLDARLSQASVEIVSPVAAIVKSHSSPP